MYVNQRNYHPYPRRIKMVSPKFFIDILKSHDIDFFAGVPDSLLKNICAYITDNLPAEQNIIAANEGGALGIAADYQ